eukprot:gb/GECG01008359.1/.p1 GENE.gb/GECG01008359.1/~~gb/GECG01008359.1/.p1  ORF type:complete len:120 (+),score=0.99 gb/GECG01008359.1/:1-360(+)
MCGYIHAVLDELHRSRNLVHNPGVSGSTQLSGSYVQLHRGPFLYSLRDHSYHSGTSIGYEADATMWWWRRQQNRPAAITLKCYKITSHQYHFPLHLSPSKKREKYPVTYQCHLQTKPFV